MLCVKKKKAPIYFVVTSKKAHINTLDMSQLESLMRCYRSTFPSDYCVFMENAIYFIRRLIDLHVELKYHLSGITLC